MENVCGNGVGKAIRGEPDFRDIRLVYQRFDLVPGRMANVAFKPAAQCFDQ